ncbi:GNAT family N-acetyltransferase [Amaricoccus sp.]|uniref:GNAT family N-acetyltransferase n=1 Tax=Amaricoccus sp. TaxID=1872485 RepID=UPI001B69C5E9|nr:GNAT family N-acetyltransferase [Amaricoccus sp.]MBP7000792.1 GNAT family N-acetyltransferase [Amaricoccus sp.]
MGEAEEVRVRPARRAEASALAALIDAAFAEYAGREPRAVWAAYLAETRDVARRWDAAEVLVAEAGGAPVGTVSYLAEASQGDMGLPAGWAGFRALAVPPAARGCGVGAALVRACAARARAAGRPALGIHTHPAMTAPLALYRRLGFVRAPELDVDAAALMGLADEGSACLVALRLDLAGRA